MAKPKKGIVPSNVGKNVRRLRVARGLTQRELAAAIGIEDEESGRVYIGRIEKGNVQHPGSNLEALAEALGTTPDELLAPPPGEAASDVADFDEIVREFRHSPEAQTLTPPFSDADVEILRTPRAKAIIIGDRPDPESMRLLVVTFRRLTAQQRAAIQARIRGK